MLPLFNKGIRKFTRVFREVFEREIAKELDEQKSQAQLTFGKKSADMKKSLNDELNEGEAQLTKKMREEKADFVKKFQKHQIKSTDEAFEQAVSGKSVVPSVLSVVKPAKRDNDEDLEELEEKHNKKDKKNKRQKTE